jgi:hypothetical protein
MADSTPALSVLSWIEGYSAVGMLSDAIPTEHGSLVPEVRSAIPRHSSGTARSPRPRADPKVGEPPALLPAGPQVLVADDHRRGTRSASERRWCTWGTTVSVRRLFAARPRRPRLASRPPARDTAQGCADSSWWPHLWRFRLRGTNDDETHARRVRRLPSSHSATTDRSRCLQVRSTHLPLVSCRGGRLRAFVHDARLVRRDVSSAIDTRMPLSLRKAGRES